MNNIAPQSPVMRRLTQQDNPAIARVIRQVSAEYGLTADKGYTVADPNLDELYQVYSQPGHAYWVVEYDGEVVGGGGIAPLAGSESDICELQKMYIDFVRDLQKAAPSLIPFTAAITDNILRGEFYNAIKCASKLVQKEEELFGAALHPAEAQDESK